MEYSLNKNVGIAIARVFIFNERLVLAARGAIFFRPFDLRRFLLYIESRNSIRFYGLIMIDPLSIHVRMVHLVCSHFQLVVFATRLQAAARALYEAKDMVKCALTLRELRDFGVDREVLVGGGVGLPNAKGVDCLEAKTDGHFLE